MPTYALESGSIWAFAFTLSCDWEYVSLCNQSTTFMWEHGMQKITYWSDIYSWACLPTKGKLADGLYLAHACTIILHKWASIRNSMPDKDLDVRLDFCLISVHVCWYLKPGIKYFKDNWEMLPWSWSSHISDTIYSPRKNNDTNCGCRLYVWFILDTTGHQNQHDTLHNVGFDGNFYLNCCQDVSICRTRCR